MRPLAMALALASLGWNALADVIPQQPVPVPEPGFYPEFALALVCLVLLVGKVRPVHAQAE
ncbi:MAG: hypothetical protein IT165_00220 [Bryobacterales bacterium]|nr:hypothetical protein [Bryobacterales bacterium]